MRAILLSLFLIVVLAASSGCRSYSSRSYARADAHTTYGYRGAPRRVAPPAGTTRAGYGVESPPPSAARGTSTTVIVQSAAPIGRPYYWHDTYWAHAHPFDCWCRPTYSTHAYVYGGYARRSYRSRAYRNGVYRSGAYRGGTFRGGTYRSRSLPRRRATVGVRGTFGGRRGR